MRNKNDTGFKYAVVLVFAMFMAVIAYRYAHGDYGAGGDSSDVGMSDSASISIVGSDVDDDPVSRHYSDLEDLDIAELVSWQEAAAALPNTADLDALSYKILNGNKPYFGDDLITTAEFEIYSDLDGLGRCGMAISNISPYTMPKDGEERGNISSIRPSGWQSVKIDGVDNGGWLYNRCHLIGYQLAAENANELNLITGTRHLNIQGMLGFENAVARYVRETGNHVLYAVTPIFLGQELVARGVLLEAYSIEDNGEGICFCAFCYNNQPGVVINYATGNAVEA